MSYMVFIIPRIVDVADVSGKYIHTDQMQVLLTEHRVVHYQNSTENVRCCMPDPFCVGLNHAKSWFSETGENYAPK